MRVISGKYKGKNIIGFDIDGTRPTMDRVKESLFASIQNKLKNSIVLDLFAGSGSLAIEALSNGSSKAYLVEKNNKLIDIIKKNISNIDEEVILINNDYKEALEYFKSKNIKFDIIFLDPPYKLNLIQDSLNKIINYNLLKDDGIIICEYENEVFNINLNIIKEKKYGSKNIRIYKNVK